MKFEGLYSTDYFQQYTGKTWLIKSYYNNNRINPNTYVLLQERLIGNADIDTFNKYKAYVAKYPDIEQ